MPYAPARPSFLPSQLCGSMSSAMTGVQSWCVLHGSLTPKHLGTVRTHGICALTRLSPLQHLSQRRCPAHLPPTPRCSKQKATYPPPHTPQTQPTKPAPQHQAQERLQQLHCPISRVNHLRPVPMTACTIDERRTQNQHDLQLRSRSVASRTWEVERLLLMYFGRANHKSASRSP